jgi:hypothetical protein
MILTELAKEIPLLHILYSLVLMLGLYQIGHLIFKFKSLNNIISQVSEIKYQKILISINLILLISYPVILFTNNLNIIPFLSFSIFALGIINIFRNIKKNLYFTKIDLKKIKFDQYLVIIVLVLLFFLSLSPNTHGDSLGYHFVVAKKLLITGNYLADITHFHSLLSGSGEILIAIGLYFGAEQFGSLLQFSGLISIYGIFKKLNKKFKFYFYLLLLTSPIILFLSSTAKPQLFHVCSTALVFSLYFFGNKNILVSKEKKLQILISIFILIVSVTAKFNFIISSFLISIFIFYNSIKDKNFLFLIISLLLSFLFFYFPLIFWKWSNFCGYIFQYLYSPLPLHIFGFEEFQQHLTEYRRGNNFIKIFLTNKPNEFTDSVGIAFMYIFMLNFSNFRVKIAVVIITIYILIHYYFAQFIGRSFLEPLFWIMLICAKYGISFQFKLFEYLCRLQVFIAVAAIIFGIYSLFPGSLTSSLKNKILLKNANGYGLFKWANNKLNKEDVVISMHRSISLGKSKYISSDFLSYVDFSNKKSAIFIEEIQKKKPNYLLTYGYSGTKPMLGKFKNCVGNAVHLQKNIGEFEARNPFNRGKKYDGYIFKLKKINMSDCME